MALCPCPRDHPSTTNTSTDTDMNVGHGFICSLPSSLTIVLLLALSSPCNREIETQRGSETCSRTQASKRLGFKSAQSCSELASFLQCCSYWTLRCSHLSQKRAGPGDPQAPSRQRKHNWSSGRGSALFPAMSTVLHDSITRLSPAAAASGWQ